MLCKKDQRGSYPSREREEEKYQLALGADWNDYEINYERVVESCRAFFD